MAVAIDIRLLSVRFRGPGGEGTVLEDFSLAVSAGEVVAVVGASGSGKTTLLNVIGGLEPSFSGEVLLDGAPVWSRPEPERARYRNRRIGFVFQDANLLEGLTARENLILPLLLSGRGAEAPERADALATALGLERKLATRAERLSGGERQRVAAARALVHEPDLVLVDEPTGNLDAGNATRILDLLLSHHETHGATLVVATHDERVMARAARIVRLSGGAVHVGP